MAFLGGCENLLGTAGMFMGVLPPVRLLGL